jgi:DNA-binding beta-propeller fold protein YncE
VLGDISVGKNPQTFVVNPKTNDVYVVNSSDGTLSSIKLPALLKGA